MKSIAYVEAKLRNKLVNVVRSIESLKKGKYHANFTVFKYESGF